MNDFFHKSVKPAEDKINQVNRMTLLNFDSMKYRVYLGEDTPTQALFIKGVLSQGGALDITTHGDGLDLLLSIQENPPDLVISDIVLPSLDGVALAKLLKFHDETRHIPLILVSALSEEYLQNLGDIGVDAFLPKPLNVPVLRDTVAHFLTESGK